MASLFEIQPCKYRNLVRIKLEHVTMPTLLLPKRLVNRPARFLFLPAEMVPLIVSTRDMDGRELLWLDSIELLWSSAPRCRSSNAKSSGGLKPDLYLSITS
jgi:hypothetical protein